MFKSKLSQISIFIIIAVLIIAVIGIFFFTRLDILNFNNINPEVKPIYSFVESCVKQTGEDAVYRIGQTGGYFEIPESASENNVAYYLEKGDKKIPLKQEIEQEIANYVDEMLFFCTQNFVEFSDFSVEQGEIKTDVEIQDKKVIFNVNYPVSISKAEESYFFEKFDSETEVRLGIIYDIIYESVMEHMTEQDICVECINKLLEKNDFYLNMQDYDDETVVFSIIDFDSTINSEEYRFYFANKYENKI